MKEIVIAHYRENLDWLDSIQTFDKKTIYNKYTGNNLLPNVGREAHTYLYHILSNYDNLAEYTLFCQGDPTFHCKDFVAKCNDPDYLDRLSQNRGIVFFGYNAIETMNSIEYPTHPLGLPIYYFLDLLFDLKPKQEDKVFVTYSAQFFVSKENILNRPKSFYEFLMKFVITKESPIEAYIYERLWSFIFNKQIHLGTKYLAFV